MKQANVSVIIVSWNTREVLHKCLYSIYEQTAGPGDISFEVIVVDNASTDSSVEMVRNNFPEVILIENSENRGFAAANNQGIAIAAGRYVLLLNSDTVVLNNAVGKVVAVADVNTDAAVVGCRILNPDRSLQMSCFMFPSILNLVLSSTYLYKLFPGSRFFGRERMTWWNRDDTREVEVVTGCFMLVRKKAIEQVGVLDERFFMYAEETDWCYRFYKNGWRIIFTPDAQVVHLGGQSSQRMRSEMYLQLRGSILLFFRKHKNLLVYAFACLLVAVFFALRVPYWLVRAAFSSTKRSDCFERAKMLARGVWYALAGGRGLLRQDRPAGL